MHHHNKSLPSKPDLIGVIGFQTDWRFIPLTLPAESTEK